MLKKRSGISIVETLLVIAISGAMFAVVIGTFSTRKRASLDDSAMQVMNQIALVRNEAQQGQTTDSIGAGSELFGKAIKIQSSQPTMTVYTVAMSSDGTNVYRIGSGRIVNMPDQLKWYINTSPTNFDSDPSNCVGYYNSCRGIGYTQYLSSSTVYLVFRNNTGQSYLLRDTEFNDPVKYADGSNQGLLRLAFGLPASGVTACGFKSCSSTPERTLFDGATAQYYAKFDLSIPNNQTLEVVK